MPTRKPSAPSGPDTEPGIVADGESHARECGLGLTNPYTEQEIAEGQRRRGERIWRRHHLPSQYVPSPTWADLGQELSREADALRRKPRKTLLDRRTLAACEGALDRLSDLKRYADGRAFRFDDSTLSELERAFHSQLRTVIIYLLSGRSPVIARWFGDQPGYPKPIHPTAKRGRPYGPTSFSQKADLYRQLVQACETLRDRGERPTQARVMQVMGHQGDTRRIREWLKCLHIPSWTDFLRRLSSRDLH